LPIQGDYGKQENFRSQGFKNAKIVKETRRRKHAESRSGFMRVANKREHVKNQE